MARVLEEKTLGTLRNQAHVAMSVHHSEGFAVLERPEGPTDERGLCLDVMLWDGLRRRGSRQFRLSDTFVQRSTPVAAVISECQLVLDLGHSAATSRGGRALVARSRR